MCQKKMKMDNKRESVPIVMVYVNNVNALVPVEDTAEYLRLFEEIGGQLGAILNTEQNKNLDVHIRH